MPRLLHGICLVLLMLACCSDSVSQRVVSPRSRDHKLRVYVCDEDGNILSGVVLCSKGKGTPSEPTDITGRTEILLSDDAAPGEAIDLVLVQDVRANQEWEILPAARVLIHAFNNKPDTFSTVPLRRRNKRQGEVVSGQSKFETASPIEAPERPKADSVDELSHVLQKTQGDLVIIYIQLGHTYYGQRRYDDALGAYNKALENSPDDDEVLYHVTLVFIQLDRQADALSAIERCLKMRISRADSIDLANTYETYASLLITSGRKDEAAQNLAVARSIRARLSKLGHKQ